MSAPTRPRRSVLYVPGSNARALGKARDLPVDGLIFDLEDAVAPSAKEAARDAVVAALREGGYGRREIIVRVNALATPWGRDDVGALAAAGADAILFPKVDGPDDVLAAVEALNNAGAGSAPPIWIMAETPRSLLRIDAIAGAHARLAAIVMGTSDLAKDLRARHTPDRAGLVTALALGVLAARAHRLAILDGVQLDLKDEAAFRLACVQGRDLGFDGKTLIHPSQIAIANEVFGPTEAEVEAAHRIIAAWEEAVCEGKGVVVVEGKLIENLHVEQARETLALARAIAAGPDESGYHAEKK